MLVQPVGMALQINVGEDAIMGRSKGIPATGSSLPSSTDQSASIWSARQLKASDRLAPLDTLQEGDGLALCPAAVIAVRFREEGAVAAVCGLGIRDVLDS